MIVAVAKEIKNNENRVGLTPAGVDALVQAGHKVLWKKERVWAAALATRRIKKQAALLWRTVKNCLIVQK